MVWQDGSQWDASPLSAAAKRRVLLFGAALGRAFSVAPAETAAPQTLEGAVAVGGEAGTGSPPATDAAEATTVREGAGGSLDEGAGPSTDATAEPAAAGGAVDAREGGEAAAPAAAPATLGPRQARPPAHQSCHDAGADTRQHVAAHKSQDALPSGDVSASDCRSASKMSQTLNDIDARQSCVQEVSEDTHSDGRGHSAPVPRVGSRLRPAHVPTSSAAGPSRPSPRKPTAAEVKAKEARRASMQVWLVPSSKCFCGQAISMRFEQHRCTTEHG